MPKIGGEIYNCIRSTDRSPESILLSRRWRGDPLLVRWPSTTARCSAARSSVFDDGAVFRCSLVGLDDGAMIRCSLVGFEWCALDGQESGVVPFGSEIGDIFLNSIVLLVDNKDQINCAKRSGYVIHILFR